MAINFIPNQPVIFEKGYPDQPCQNNDNRAYAQLVSKGDNTCFQVQVTPCSEQLLCNPEMLDIGSNIIPKAPGDWTETAGTDWTYTAGVSFQYTAVTPGNDVIESSVTVTPNAAYRLTIFLSAITTPLTITFGNEFRILTTPGLHVLYFVPVASPVPLKFGATGVGTITIGVNAPNPFELVQMTNDCWSAQSDFAFTAWEYSETNGQGKFCARFLTGTLVNTNAYANDNEYHRVRITISNCTTGNVEILLGGVSLGLTPLATNGTFEFYGTPTDLSGELRVRMKNSFDGCVSNIDVYEYTMPSLRLLLNGSIVGIVKPPDTIVRDRAIWCIDWNNTYFETDLSCNYYSLQLFYACNEVDYDYKALSFFAYNPDPHPCTFVLSGSNVGEAFGLVFDDEAGNPVFSLNLRLRMLAFSPTYPAKGEEYLTSAGNTLRTYTETAKTKTVQFDRVDEPTHDCIRLILLSDAVTLADNNNTYDVFFPAQDYEPEWNDRGKYNLAQSRADIIFLNEPSRFNRSC